MALVPALLLLAAGLRLPPAAADPGLGFDLDGDGTIDERWLRAAAGARADRDGDGTLGVGPGPGPAPATERRTDLDFRPVWDSGGILSNVLGLGAGDADRDGELDFAGAHFNPNVIHLFAPDGGGGYQEIWNSAAATPPGAYVDFACGDTDGDGRGEIFAAEVSTLGKVMLFEQSAGGFVFMHDTIRESDFVGTRRPRKVLIGDTDGDGREEVILACGGSAPTDGLVSIWEHSGAPGENLYTRVYAYTTVSYIFSAALGDTDRDGRPEIVLGLGGTGGFPIYIRRIEYEPALGTWVHTIFQTTVIGLPTAPHVADLDEDGEPELAFGCSGFVAVFENTGENTYALRHQTAASWNGNLLALASRRLTVPGTMSLAAGSFGGDLRVLSYDPDLAGWQETFAAPGVGGPIRGLALADDGGDGFEEMIAALGAVDQLRVWRRVPGPSAIPGGAEPAAPLRLAAAPNPFAAEVRIEAPLPTAGFLVFDAGGRRVRALVASRSAASWDGRDEQGHRVARGVYWIRPLAPGRPASTAVVFAP